MMNELLTRLAVTLNTGDGSDTKTVDIPEVSAGELLVNGLELVYFLAGTISVIVIIIGGIMYVSSSGDAGRVTKAKNLLLYSIVGLVIVLVAFVATRFITGRFS